MDVRPDQLIDMSLTAAGLLAAGGFCVVVYSMFGRRRTVSASTPEAELPGMPVPQTYPSASQSRRNTIEYVSLSTPPRSVAEAAISDADQADLRRRRNRTDIIRQARQMIERGAATTDITQSLRMTDGEVALLRQDNNR
jgi:hypothetical protein